jgi:hypothetical protein
MSKRIIAILIMVFLNFGLFVSADIAKPDFGPLVYEDTEIPKILSRSIWENSESLRKLLTWYPGEDKSPTAPEKGDISPPDYFNIERIVIHDMGCDVRKPGCNNKQRNPLEIIQGIYRYHSATRGWGDIGYHYIIDYWGNIYEGRYGGNGARGAHTYYDRKCNNFNVGTVGILLMGNYENAQLSEIMHKSLARLVAWISTTNSLDPSDLSHYSEVWHSPKKGKTCDISQGGLTSHYTGPVVVSHGGVEEGNSDAGTVDLKRVREKAKQIVLDYKNYLFSEAGKGDSKIYTIRNGELREFKLNTTNYKIINLARHQLETFLNTSINKLNNGTLVKSDSRDRVYLMENNKRRAILSEQLFNLRKYNWNSIISLSDRNLAVYSLANPLPYPEGTLIKGEGTEVYLVENEKRRHITSPILFKKKGFIWDNIIEISGEELLAHPVGENLLFSDDTLIKGAAPEVYLIKSQKRHWIKTAEVFSDSGFRWQDIIELPGWEINQYALGMVIVSFNDLDKLNGQISEEIIEEEKVELFEEPLIRIGIYSVETNEIFKITANGPYEIYKNNQFLDIKNKNQVFEVETDAQNSFKFVPKTEDTIFEIVSYENHPQWNPSLNDNLFRGIVEVKYSDKSKKIWIINELNLEKYLKGVAEAIDNHPMEYLKSLAVAARSYALFHIQNNGKYPGEIFHLRNWAFDQLYKGYGFESRAPNIVKAMEETESIIVTYADKPIRGVYSSDSGGITKDACVIWRGIFCEKQYDYLRGGIKDPAGTTHDLEAVRASHGVGISAVGARELAEIGKNYEEILKYYYLGIEIEKLY